MDPNGSPERLFFALWPSAEMQQRFQAVAESALTPRSAGRRTLVANLHITLAFLGSVDAATRSRIEGFADVMAIAPFDLMLDRLSSFRRGQLLWLGASRTPEPLLQLVEALRAAQSVCGLAPDTRPYRAHVTLARNLRRGPSDATIEPLVWPVREFVLVRSTLSSAGARYEVLRAWTLE